MRLPCAECVAIARHRRGVLRRRVERGEAIHAVVLDGGLQLVGIGDGDQVAGRVVGVGGGVLAGEQVVVHHRAEPVEGVVGVGHGRAVQAGRVDGGHPVTCCCQTKAPLPPACSAKTLLESK